MRLSAALATLVTTATVLADDRLIITNYNPGVCFIHADNTAATLILNVTEYKADKNLDELQKKFQQAETVQLIAFRKNKIDLAHQFQGQHTRLRHCVPEAVDLGFCKEEDLGKFLYKPKEEGYAPLINGAYRPFNASEETQSVVTSEIDEKGYYCVETSSRWAESYKVELTFKDGHSLKRDARHSLMISALDFVVDILLLLLLVLPWIGTPMPYILKWQVFLRATAFIYMIWDDYEQYRYNIGHFDPSGSNSFVLSFARDSQVLWIETFMYYQYSGEFTYNKITEFDDVNLFIIIQLTLVYDFIVEALKFQTGMQLSEAVTPVVATTLAVILTMASMFTKAYIYFRMFKRYSQSVKLFTDFNKSNHPTLKQFRSLFWLDWTRTFLLPPVFFLTTVVQKELLPKLSTYYTEKFTIDGKEYAIELMGMVLIVILSGGLQAYVIWTYWTPRYFKKVEEHKERDE